jgi:tRNA C32,U32 (ribose-2'-O)-methylase TrmJ
LQNSTAYHKDYTTPTALVVGTEATGLTQEWRDAATQNIIIPMQGEIDSMNVSVAAAILILKLKTTRVLISEIKRKTQFKKRKYKKQIICSDNSIIMTTSFGQITEPSGCFSEQNLNRI